MEQRVEGIIEHPIKDVHIALSSITLRGNYDKMFNKGGMLEQIGEDDLLSSKYSINYMKFNG